MRFKELKVRMLTFGFFEAEHAGINVSRVLQEALMNTLGVTRRER